MCAEDSAVSLAAMSSASLCVVVAMGVEVLGFSTCASGASKAANFLNKHRFRLDLEVAALVLGAIRGDELVGGLDGRIGQPRSIASWRCLPMPFRCSSQGVGRERHFAPSLGGIHRRLA